MLERRPPAPSAHGMATLTGSPDSLVKDVRVVRQPIYDCNRAVVAYELCFVGSGLVTSSGAPGLHPLRSLPPGPQAERATSQVMVSTFGLFGLETISNGRPVFIPFTRAFLCGLLPIPTDPTHVVIEVGPRVMSDPAALAGLARLREDGYRVAVHGWQGSDSHDACLDVADYVMVDIATTPLAVLPALLAAVRRRAGVPVAVNVNDAAHLRKCVDLGFELLQGEYLARPSLVAARSLTPTQLVCARLLNELSQPEVRVDRVNEIASADPGLTLRILKAASSASAGGREVSSLRQALVMVGTRLLRSWVVLSLMDGASTQQAGDLMWNVLARATAVAELSGPEPEIGYTVGLLSAVADLLGQTPGQIALASGVSGETRAALVHQAGPAGAALAAVLAHESGDVQALSRLPVRPLDVSNAYLAALQSCAGLVRSLTN